MTVISPPGTYSHPLLEYDAVTHAVVLIDLAQVGVLRLTGADRVRFLNAMVTNDVSKLATGTSCGALMTTTKGRVVAELLVLARPDELLILVLQGAGGRVAEVLESHIIADDVTLEDVSTSHAVLSLEGPKSRDLVWRIFPREPLPLEPFKFTENEYQGMRALVVRHSLTGEKGLHVIVSREHHERMRNYLVQGGVGMDLAVLGRTAWNMRRLEAGIPWYGSDVTEENFPKEARLDSMVNYEKGCYMGQEPIARMHYRGHPNWLLVGLTTVGDPPAPLQYPVKLDEVAARARDAEKTRVDSEAFAMTHTSVVGAELFVDSSEEQTKSIGRITSGAFSPRLGRALFLGYVRASLATPEARFRLQVGSEAATLAIVDLPLKGETIHA